MDHVSKKFIDFSHHKELRVYALLNPLLQTRSIYIDHDKILIVLES